MKRQGKTVSAFGIYALLSLLLLLQLALGPSATQVYAAAEPPLKLNADLDEKNGSLKIELIAAETITLSNYDALLDWDKDAFSLREITNEQGAKFVNFQANTTAGSAKEGKISAASAGNNVAIPAGDKLATYLLDLADGTAEGKYSFRLSMADAANEDGEALPWKGETISTEIAISAGQTPEAKIIGLRKNESGVSAEAACASDEDMLCCVAYDDKGRLLEYRTASAKSGDGTARTYEFAFRSAAAGSFKLMILHGGVPLCAAKEIE